MEFVDQAVYKAARTGYSAITLFPPPPLPMSLRQILSWCPLCGSAVAPVSPGRMPVSVVPGDALTPSFPESSPRPVIPEQPPVTLHDAGIGQAPPPTPPDRFPRAHFLLRPDNSATTDFYLRAIHPFEGVRNVVVHVTFLDVDVVIPHPETTAAAPAR
jgi:hypothetical protein